MKNKFNAMFERSLHGDEKRDRRTFRKTVREDSSNSNVDFKDYTSKSKFLDTLEIELGDENYKPTFEDNDVQIKWHDCEIDEVVAHYCNYKFSDIYSMVATDNTEDLDGYAEENIDSWDKVRGGDEQSRAFDLLTMLGNPYIGLIANKVIKHNPEQYNYWMENKGSKLDHPQSIIEFATFVEDIEFFSHCDVALYDGAIEYLMSFLENLLFSELYRVGIFLKGSITLTSPKGDIVMNTSYVLSELEQRKDIDDIWEKKFDSASIPSLRNFPLRINKQVAFKTISKY